MRRPRRAKATAVDVFGSKSDSRIRGALVGKVVRLDAVGTVLAATIIGGAIRFSTLNLQSFWDDEVFTVLLMRGGFVDMLETVPETEGSPHLYYVLAWGWTHIFGTGEWGLRSLSALLGTATIPVVYFAARGIGSRRGAAIAAFLVAANPLLVWYSQEARTYALLVLLSALSFFAFTRALRGEARRLMWWAVTAGLALAAHYFAIFIVAPEAAWLLFSLGLRRATLGAVGIVAAVAGALLPLALHQSERAGGRVLDTALEPRVVKVPVQLLVGYGVSAMTVGKLAAAASVFLVGLAIWLLIVRSPTKMQRVAALAGAVAAFTIVVPILAAYAGIDYLKTQYLIGSLPLFAIAFAQGFAATRAGSVAAAALIAIGFSLTALVAATPWLQRPDLRGVASALGRPTVTRGLVIAPTSQVSAYMGGLRSFPEVAQLREVVFVALPVKEPGESPLVPRTLSQPFAATGFKPSGRIFADRFTILRFRAPRARRVTLEELLRASYPEWPPELTLVAIQKAAGP